MLEVTVLLLHCPKEGADQAVAGLPLPENSSHEVAPVFLHRRNPSQGLSEFELDAELDLAGA